MRLLVLIWIPFVTIACTPAADRTRDDASEGEGDATQGEDEGDASEGEGEGDASEGEGESDASEGEGEGDAPDPLTLDRDRLLDTLGARCDTWSALDDTQRAEFLLLTDLLGTRTLLADGTSALAHITLVHAIRGAQTEGCVRCCGDREFNRIYFSVDTALLDAWRTSALAAWRPSTDAGGPHEPFTASQETLEGQPRGQVQFFAQDSEAVALGRADVEDVVDARAVEVDLDFNLIHESSPTCTYGGTTGLERYEALWGAAALDYVPTGC